MNDIRNWFNSSRKYEDGVQLYLQHGHDDKLKRLFQEGSSEFKIKKLASALEELLHPCCDACAEGHTCESEKPAPKPLVRKDPPKAKTFSADRRWSQKRDEVEESLYQQWRPLYAEMMNLQARVGEVARSGNQTEAGRMALRILELDDICEAIYDKRNEYRETGKLKYDAKPVDISLDPMLWPKMLANHQRYAREFRNKLKKDASNTSAAEHLQKHEWAVTEYKKLLKIS